MYNGVFGFKVVHSSCPEDQRQGEVGEVVGGWGCGGGGGSMFSRSNRRRMECLVPNLKLALVSPETDLP